MARGRPGAGLAGGDPRGVPASSLRADLRPQAHTVVKHLSSHGQRGHDRKAATSFPGETGLERYAPAKLQRAMSPLAGRRDPPSGLLPPPPVPPAQRRVGRRRRESRARRATSVLQPGVRQRRDRGGSRRHAAVPLSKGTPASCVDRLTLDDEGSPGSRSRGAGAPGGRPDGRRRRRRAPCRPGRWAVAARERSARGTQGRRRRG